MNRIQSITVVGDGLTGWLAALAVRSVFGRRVEVVVVRDGARRSTSWATRSTSALPSLLTSIGIPEEDFLRACDATFRCGSLYESWGVLPGDFLVPTGDGSESMINLMPLATFPVLGRGLAPLDLWMRSAAKGNAAPLAESRELTREFFQHDLAPKREPGTKRYETAPPYGFHLDPTAFEALLKALADERGVQHVVEELAGVDVDERRRISALKTTSGRVLRSDLYLDCTDRPGSPLFAAVGGEFIESPSSRVCDRHVSVRVERAMDAPLPTTTRIARLSSGWSHVSPLASSTVHGYFYSSSHSNDSDALAELCNARGLDTAVAVPVVEEVGAVRAASPWVGNCVAVGRGASALDDIGATHWSSLSHQLGNLIVHLPPKEGNADHAEAYNTTIATLHDVIQDYVDIHALHSQPSTSAYWSELRNTTRPSVRTVERVTAFRQGLAGQSAVGRSSSQGRLPEAIFDRWQHFALLSAFGMRPVSYPAVLDHFDLEPWAQYLRQQKLSAERLRRELPTHAAYIDALRATTPQ